MSLEEQEQIQWVAEWRAWTQIILRFDLREDVFSCKSSPGLFIGEL